MEANTTTEEKYAPAQPAVTTEVNEAKPAKDPGQVAAGKKNSRTQYTCSGSKKTSLRLKSTAAPADSPTATEQNKSNNIYLILGAGGLIVSALGICYRHEAIMSFLREKNESLKPEADFPGPLARIPKRVHIREMD